MFSEVSIFVSFASSLLFLLVSLTSFRVWWHLYQIPYTIDVPEALCVPDRPSEEKHQARDPDHCDDPLLKELDPTCTQALQREHLYFLQMHPL